MLKEHLLISSFMAWPYLVGLKLPFFNFWPHCWYWSRIRSVGRSFRSYIKQHMIFPLGMIFLPAKFPWLWTSNTYLPVTLWQCDSDLLTYLLLLTMTTKVLRQFSTFTSALLTWKISSLTSYPNDLVWPVRARGCACCAHDYYCLVPKPIYCDMIWTILARFNLEWAIIRLLLLELEAPTPLPCDIPPKPCLYFLKPHSFILLPSILYHHNTHQYCATYQLLQ
jgi:hypothetical protein